MGRGNWERHVIINTQPKDPTVNLAVQHLKNKPVREQWHQRQVFDLELVKSGKVKFRPTDKVYLVGHGGTSTLGGMDPMDLAFTVRSSMAPAGQVSLVMCGVDGINNAEIFADKLTEGEEEGKHRPAVYAY